MFAQVAPPAAHEPVLAGLGVALLAFGLYLIPTLVAALRNHRQLVPLFIINLFLGVTAVAWVVCLAWAFVAARAPEYVRRERSWDDGE